MSEEQLLESLVPRKAGEALRSRLLEAVGRALDEDQPAPALALAGWLVAAVIMAGILLNLWLVRSEEERALKMFGPSPTPQAVKDVAQAVGTVTDADTAQRVEQELNIIIRRQRNEEQPSAWELFERYAPVK